MEAGRDGQVLSFGADPPGHSALAGVDDVVAMAAMMDGYFLVGSDGGVFELGTARFRGSLPSRWVHVGDIVGVAVAAGAAGYWLVGSNGAVYAFGRAAPYGSLAGSRLSAPAVGIATTPDGRGYWLVASDDGVFAFGDARFLGSATGARPALPIVAINN